MTRRYLLAVAAHVCAACAAPMSRTEDGRGLVRRTPRTPATTIEAGEHPLGLNAGRDGLLFVPRSYRADTPAPLVVMLHGAGGTGARMRFTFAIAEEFGIVVLAPDSRDNRTWDAIRGDFGRDVEFLERALDHTFERCAISATRIAIGGFSDGASYALSVGLASGNLFTNICAFSPGFVVPATPSGHPAIFISHGRRDNILPIHQASRRIVPQLRAQGYRVIYREFDGGHTVPVEMIREAFQSLSRG